MHVVHRYMCGSDNLPAVGPLLAFFLIQPLLIGMQEYTNPIHLALRDYFKSTFFTRPWQMWLIDVCFDAGLIVGTLMVLLYTAEGLFWPSFETGCRIDMTGMGEFMELISWVRGAIARTS